MRIKAMREARGMSQRELSYALEHTISQSGIARIEKGTMLPTASELLALSWVFGIAIEELTDDIPLSERMTWAARSTGETDITAVRAELVAQLQLRNTVEELMEDTHA